MSIHQRIRTARVMQDITLEYLADKIGRNLSTWSKIENGSQLPTVEDLQMVKKVFDMSYEYLIDGKAQTLMDWKCEAMINQVSGRRVRKSKRETMK